MVGGHFYCVQMDHVDAPYVPIKQRKGKTTFQQELDDRMRQRRKQGLTYDLTSEESEGQDYDSQEENSRFLSLPCVYVGRKHLCICIVLFSNCVVL